MHLLHELRIGEVAGSGGPYAALDAAPEKGEVAEKVEELVACQLVVGPELKVVEVTARDPDVLLVEDFLEVLELLVRYGILDNDDGIVEVAALDEVHLEERFELVQEHEGAAGSDLARIIVVGIERGVLVADDLRVVVDVYRYREDVIGVEYYGDALFGYGVDHFLGHLVVFAFGVLLDKTRFDDLFCILSCGTVHDRGFRSIDVYQGVVDPECPECRHDMLNGADTCRSAGDGRAARGVGDELAQCRYRRLAFKVGAAEHDAEARFGGIDRHVDGKTRVQALSRECYGRFECVLF